jgi:hypothetical protein
VTDDVGGVEASEIVGVGSGESGSNSTVGTVGDPLAASCEDSRLVNVSDIRSTWSGAASTMGTVGDPLRTSCEDSRLFNVCDIRSTWS